VIQRDYIERLIEQCAELLRRALQLRKAGELEPSLRALRKAQSEIAGDLRPLLERACPAGSAEVRLNSNGRSSVSVRAS
jgi:hypothetical protein